MDTSNSKAKDAMEQAEHLFAYESLGDDPRFALWAARKPGDDDDIILCSRKGNDDGQSVGPAPPQSASGTSTSPPSQQQQTQYQRAIPWMAGQQSEKRKSLRSSVSSNSDASVASSGNTASGNRTSNKPRPPTTAGGPMAHASSVEEAHHSLLFPSHGPFLIAASMPCIITELTSHIDNRFMTDFFYTYRSYVTSHDLLQLLIARFHWTLSPSSIHDDEAKRNIVRVRTYVVIKYWLTNFFTMDFLPNRALRTQFTDWLNNFSRDVAMDSSYQHTQAGLGIIKNLKKVVRNLKAAYEKTGIGGLLMADEASTPRMLTESTSHPDGLDEAGAHDGCVSLALGDEASEPSFSPLSSRSPVVDDSAAATKRTTTSPTAPSSAVYRAKHAVQHHPNSVGPQHAPPPLPTSQGAISRAFISTFSRLSRFKRHLNARASTNPFLGEGIDGTDYDTNNCGDLLFMRGGLEGFLDFFELRAPAPTSSSSQQAWLERDSAGNTASEGTNDPATSDGATARDEETPSLSSNQTRSTPASSFDLNHGSPINNDQKSGFGLGISDGDRGLDSDENDEYSDSEAPFAAELSCSAQNALSYGILQELEPHATQKDASTDLLHHFQSDQTLRSASRSRAQPTTLRLDQSSRQASNPRMSRQTSREKNSVVLIDDIDLSSDEDDGMVRRALRRLPAARDLRTAQNVTQLEAPERQSFDSVSSFGRVYDGSRRSLASYFGNASIDDGAAVAAYKTSVVTSEMLDPDEALRGYELVKGFRLEHLEDSDEEEAGDVEAALRRLEGVIDADKERERARKVENMWQRSQTRQQDETSKRSMEETQSETSIDDEATHQAGADNDKMPTPSQSSNTMTVHTEADSATPPSKSAESAQQSLDYANKDHVNKGHGESVQGTKGEVVAGHRTTSPQAPLRLPRSVWAPPPVHRSFLLDYHSDVIAQQFSLIEAELFRAVAWQELVSGQWKVKHHEGPVHDWELFYQARARNRVRAQKQGSTSTDVAVESSVEAITARFKLTCNWVASEIVLTNSVEARAAVVRKLIRIAWKCYHHSNFATLTQIILGLQVPSVERLAKTWARVGVLEMRMLRDLKAFINPARNFKHLRDAMRDMMVQGQMEDLIIASGPPRSGKKDASARSDFVLNDGCIPFFGLLLSDLAVYDGLPSLVDPSSPDAVVDVETSSGFLARLAKPDAFDHLPVLSSDVRLSPLVNLYKYRILAMTVKTVLALQERLDVFNFPINRGVYVKSLKLRCLEPEQLKVISLMAEP